MMLQIYCKKHHKAKMLCGDCIQFEQYAHQKLDRCRYGNQKSTCKNCPVHCYSPEMRKQIRDVMEYSGPRLIIFHPIKALDHIILSV